ncbi:MAG: hypothetical protein LBQ66_02290 [Planctomycetaceae bacterium]|jgi:hypothetical protein|nr:hypothetical protein [Planctomycetaceae bacterium]
MPFQSKAQQRWMFATRPEMAKEWAEQTDFAELPEKLPEKLPVKKKKKKQKLASFEQLLRFRAVEKLVNNPVYY